MDTNELRAANVKRCEFEVKEPGYLCIKLRDSYNDWFEQLQTIAKNRWCYEISDDMKDDWREYYHDNFDPLEALGEDYSAGL